MKIMKIVKVTKISDTQLEIIDEIKKYPSKEDLEEEKLMLEERLEKINTLLVYFVEGE